MEKQIGRAFKYVAIIKYKCYFFVQKKSNYMNCIIYLLISMYGVKNVTSLGQKHSRICKVEIDINIKLYFLQ